MPSRVPPEQDWVNDDPPRRQPFAPGTQPEPGAVFAWKFDDGTRYAWSLPFNYQPGESFDVIVLLHPSRGDFRWGFANHKREPAGFRPNDIVISVDGLGGDQRRPNQRVFDPTVADPVRFRDVMLEITRKFPMKRLYIYGSGSEAGAGGGGEYAAAFAMAFPALADGVLIHGASIDDEHIGASSTPIVLMHGSKDALVPLHSSRMTYAAFKSKGHKLVRHRTLHAYNDYVNAARASECLDYLQGARADDAADVLGAADRLLSPKPVDEYNYAAAVWYAGAYEALERLTGSGDNKIEKVSEQQLARAQAIQARIDDEAKAHVETLEKLVGPAGSAGLALDGGEWLGYLMAFREDFRGVPSAEQYIASIGLDAMIAEHAARAEELWTAWNDRGEDDNDAAKIAFETIVDLIPACYLYEALPPGLTGWMRAVHRRADELAIDPAAADKFEYCKLLDTGWRSGLSAYQQRWKLWMYTQSSANNAAGETNKPE